LTVAVGMGVYPNMEAVDALIEISHSVEPQCGLGTHSRARYEALYREYQALYRALSPIYHRLHASW
jgi:ribulose kinase